MILQKLFICWKFLLFFAKLPKYLYKNHRLVWNEWRGFIAGFINLEKEFQHRVERVPVPSCRDRVFLFPYTTYGNISFLEAYCLSVLVRNEKPKRIFEFGTYDGYATWHMAMNSSKYSEVYTLNLPIEEKVPGNFPGDQKTHDQLREKDVGVLYKNCSKVEKVIQLWGNSLTFDFTPYHNTMDFVFIDGGHSWDCIWKDTENALIMLKADGLLVWHDFNVQHRHIYRFLLSYAKEVSLSWIKDTRLAFMTA